MPEPGAKQKMISAAVRLFRRQGYERTSMLDVVRESGGPRGSLYHYFPGGKADMGRQAVDFASAAVRSWIEAAGQASESPADFVRRLGGAYRGALEGSGFGEGCPIATVALETAPAVPELAEACARGFASWVGVAAEAFARHGIEPAEARELATHAVSAIEGALILSRSQRSCAPLDAALRQLERLATLAASA